MAESVTPDQITLVQQTFERAARMGPHVAQTFYSELFAIDPSLRAMFKRDMIAQGQKLMSTLKLVVESLNAPEHILPAAQHLAVKHLDYGVEARHYTMVGTALTRTLRHELGADFTPEARAAWAAAYQWLADAMRNAAYGADTSIAV